MDDVYDHALVDVAKELTWAEKSDQNPQTD